MLARKGDPILFWAALTMRNRAKASANRNRGVFWAPAPARGRCLWQRDPLFVTTLSRTTLTAATIRGPLCLTSMRLATLRLATLTVTTNSWPLCVTTMRWTTAVIVVAYHNDQGPIVVAYDNVARDKDQGSFHVKQSTGIEGRASRASATGHGPRREGKGPKGTGHEARLEGRDTRGKGGGKKGNGPRA